MLQRNDTGHTVVVHGPDGVVAVHHGDVMDYPAALFGWTAVEEGTPVVVIPGDEPEPEPATASEPAAQADGTEQPEQGTEPATTSSARARTGSKGVTR